MRSIIAWPAPNAQNTEAAHGSALGDDEVAATKRVLGFDPEQTFEVADEVLAHTREALDRGREAHAGLGEAVRRVAHRQPGARRSSSTGSPPGELPAGWEEALPVFEAGKAVATRAASGKVLQALGAVVPELWGGSADLAGSNNTTIDKTSSFLPEGNPLPEADPYGRTIHFGIREHSMAAEMNGIALHGNTRIYGGTFLVFSDYMRNAVRLSALMHLPVTYVWTHDSIGLGEDGPTHQPVEHLASLRAIPGLNVVRPADANETAIAWREILKRHATEPGPARPGADPPGRADVRGQRGRGARAVTSCSRPRAGRPEVILIATGSEVQLAVEAREQLEAEGVATRVVSMPSVEWFEEQAKRYRDSVLPPSVKARVAVEAGIGLTWHRYVGDAGRIVSLEHFGASADAKVLFREFGFTAEAVAAAARESRRRRRAVDPIARRKMITVTEATDADATATADLKRLSDEGVAIWLDDLSRKRITSGNLAELIDQARRGRHHQPVDLPEGDRLGRRLRAAAARPRRPQGHRRRGRPHDHHGGRPRRRRHPAPGLRRHRRPGRPGLHRGRPAPGPQHRGDVAEAKQLAWLVDRPNIRSRSRRPRPASRRSPRSSAGASASTSR